MKPRRDREPERDCVRCTDGDGKEQRCKACVRPWSAVEADKEGRE